MKTRFGVVTILLLAILALGVTTDAFAQPKSAPPPAAPAVTATTPGIAMIKSITPASFTSSPDEDVDMDMIIRGTGLLGQTDIKVGSLTMTVVTNNSNSVLKLKVTVPKDDEAEHIVSVGPVVTEHKLVTKTKATVDQEAADAKVKAEEAATKRAIAAGAAAAGKVRTLETAIAALKAEIAVLKVVDTALGGRINAAQESATNAVKTATTALTTSTSAAEMATVAQDDALFAIIEIGDLAQVEVKKSVFGGKRPLDPDLARRVAERLAAKK